MIAAEMLKTYYVRIERPYIQYILKSLFNAFSVLQKRNNTDADGHNSVIA